MYSFFLHTITRISPIELKYFTSRRRRFSHAIDFLGSFLFGEDGSLLYGSELTVGTASDFKLQLKLHVISKKDCKRPACYEIGIFKVFFAQLWTWLRNDFRLRSPDVYNDNQGKFLQLFFTASNSFLNTQNIYAVQCFELFPGILRYNFFDFYMQLLLQFLSSIAQNAKV